MSNSLFNNFDSSVMCVPCNPPPADLRFRAHRPFHPARLHAALEARAAARAGGDASTPLARVEHLDGIAWVATLPARQALVSVAGDRVAVECGPPWWVMVARAQWPVGLARAIAPLWREPHGDRQVELALRGGELADDGDARDAIDAALRACLLDDDEFSRVEACMVASENDEISVGETRARIGALFEGDDPYSRTWASGDV